ncbi:hypothetical protein LEP1GSC108_0091 [Leptospira weilii str. UI 13098]|uniref:Uncharacterized protein n=1 Tax=Leptospira weilii str. UI 13098 TaxID=1088542 RepID=M6QIA4_9LEPT|nr:hypothetical protein LEP1GSC108_0091 [Leptospira weilii str. UI 13098]
MVFFWVTCFGYFSSYRLRVGVFRNLLILRVSLNKIKIKIEK